MLSYQHGYHAGAFADVVKHLTLTRIINYMIDKDKPLFYLETHSGRGIYDLKDGQATKTAEFRQGISLLWEERKKLTPLFTPYLHILNSLNPNDKLRFYPGSPFLAISQLRSQDRLVCAELHPREFAQLEQLPTQQKRVCYSHSDGIKEMEARLPPTERRGLIFIDPSYEMKDEYKKIPAALKSAYLKFSVGVYCLWYPLIDNRLHKQLLTGLKNIDADRMLRIEFSVTPVTHAGMSGCGLCVINPPYTLAEEMKSILSYLRTIYNPGISSYLVEAL